VAVVLLVLGLASAAGMPAAKAAHQARVQDYVAKSFPLTAVLDADRPVQGVVFFSLAETSRPAGTVLPEAAAARGRTFDEEPRSDTPPPPWLRATVANMAGSDTRPPFVLQVEMEDGAEITAKAGDGRTPDGRPPGGDYPPALTTPPVGGTRQWPRGCTVRA
jgi:hypothetical protein